MSIFAANKSNHRPNRNNRVQLLFNLYFLSLICCVHQRLLLLLNTFSLAPAARILRRFNAGNLARSLIVLVCIATPSYAQGEPEYYTVNPDLGCFKSKAQALDVYFKFQNPDSHSKPGYICERDDCVDFGTGASCIGHCTRISDGLTDSFSWNVTYQSCAKLVNKTKNNGDILACLETGNPINIGVGNKYQFETDLPAINTFSLTFQRHYNSSNATLESSLGSNWRSNYDALITQTTNLDVTAVNVYRPDGKTYYFIKNGDAWTADADITDTLMSITNANGEHEGWKYTTANDSEEIYLANGKLASVQDSQGNIKTLIYSESSGLLEHVTNMTGESLLFSYDNNRRIQSLTHTVADNSTRVWGYRYDANNNLQYVDNPDGTTREYHYEEQEFIHALTGITDERGIRYAHWEYDGQGNAKSSYHGPQTNILTDRIDGVSIAYISDGSRSVTNSLGNTTTYATVERLGVVLPSSITGAGCPTCNDNSTSYVYDDIGNLLSKTENGLTTTYGNYDSQGNPAYIIKAVGTAEERRTDYSYDQRFHSKVLTKNEPSVFNGAQKVTTYNYDDSGNTTRITIDGYKPDGTPVKRTVDMQYNGPLNQLTLIDGPRANGSTSDVTELDYYPNDSSEGTNRARLKSITGPAGIILRDNIQYTATGKVLSETRPNGLQIVNTYYPGNDRLETTTETAGGVSRVTRWTYLATGEVETITIADGTADAATLTFGYDVARRLIRIDDALGNFIQFELDTEGNTTAEKTHDKNGVLYKQLSRIFDQYGHLDTQSLQNETDDYNYTVSGQLNSITNTNSVVTKFSYDELERLSEITTDFGGIEAGTADTVTSFGYDIEGRITSIKSPNNSDTIYLYDDLGNKISESSPDRGVTNYTYDDAGNMTSVKNARNIIVQYSYDSLNRVTAIDYPGTEEDVSLEYDVSANCANGAGRLCKIQSAEQTTEYSYDAFGNTLEKIVSTQNKVFSSIYTYDLLGNTKTITMPSGRTITYGRDKLGRVLNIDAVINNSETVVLDNVTYTPDSQITAMDYGNGHHALRTYNGKGRLSSLSMPIHNATSDGNLHPISNAGVNQHVTSADTVTLDGSASNDPDGNVIAYQWSLIAENGVQVSISDSTQAIASFVAPVVETATQIDLLLSVIDNHGAMANDVVSITIMPANEEPDVAPTGVTISTNVASPQTTGTNVTFSGQGVGGSGPYEYRFYRIGPDTGNVWTLVQNYSTNNTYVLPTTVAQVGSHTVQVNVRNIGSSADYEAAQNSSAFTVNSTIVAPTSATITTNVASPQTTGTNVTFSGQGVGGTGPYEYRFYRIGPDTGNVWTLVQNYSTNNTYVLPTTAAQVGSHTVQVNVRNIGSSADYEAAQNAATFTVNSTIVAPTSATITTNVASPQTTGTNVTFSGQGVGGSGPYEYRFYRIGPDTGNVWTLVQNYSTNNTYVLPTTVAQVGSHTVQVNVRNIGSSADYEVYHNSGTFTVNSTSASMSLHGLVKPVALLNAQTDLTAGKTLQPTNVLERFNHGNRPDSIMLVLAYKKLLDTNNEYPMWIRNVNADSQWTRASGSNIDYQRTQALIVVSEKDFDLWYREPDKRLLNHKHMKFDGIHWLASNYKVLHDAKTDGEYRLQNASHTAWVPSQTDISLLLTENWVYTYDLGGNLETITKNDGLAVFEYDALDRLIVDAQDSLETWFFDYDRNGNRLSQSMNGATNNLVYKPDSNRLQTIDGSNIGRDAAGNRISDRGGNRTFTYNEANRLYQVFEGGQLVATYYYNALGQRTRKVTASGTVFYHYDLSDNLIAETDAAGNPVKDYIYLGNIPVAQVEVSGSTDNIVYLHTDHLNTPRRATDSTGNVVWQWDSQAFGNTAVNQDPDGDGHNVELNLRFPGQYYDEETGLHYNYFRYYDPQTGRYITSDPIGLQGGLNTYGYVGGNPLYWSDPYGLAAILGNYGGYADSGSTGSSVVIPGWVKKPPSPWWFLIYTGDVGVGSDIVPFPPYFNEDGNDVDGKNCPPDLPDKIPDFDFNDPSNPPVGSDGSKWPWKGLPPQGGDKGGYKNPNGPESLHPDLDHGGDIGPHWDFNDREGPGYRIGPDGKIYPK